jgi:phosphatidylinositol 4-kinase
MNEEGIQKDPVLFDVLEALSNNMIGALSGPAKRFYEREFDFFGKITAIFGEIRSFAALKKACSDTLRKIEVQMGCYLPSKPEAMILDIDYNSGTSIIILSILIYRLWIHV